jgi:SAM-dependent methyltransferase
MSFSAVTACRSCGQGSLRPLVDLGAQPLANALRDPDDTTEERRFPLAVVVCEQCTLPQLTGTVDPRLMFTDYRYLSSYSAGMVAEMEALAGRLVRDRSLSADTLVVEVASNDGYLLKHYRALEVPVLGVEPAARPARIATDLGVPTVVDFFTSALAKDLRAEGHRARILHANNVLAHVPDINDFVGAMEIVLDDNGLLVIETPHAVAMVDGNEFDTIYHEHVFYYTLAAIEALFARHGLGVSDVETLPHHGGSLRVFVERDGQPSERVVALRAAEGAAGVGTARWGSGFGAGADRVVEELREFLTDEATAGRQVAGYAAAAKGAVLLNHGAVGVDLLPYVVDRNPAKHGLLMPGTRQPVYDVARLLSERPDTCLVLAWNHADEVVREQAAYREAGGQFVVAVPALRRAQ